MKNLGSVFWATCGLFIFFFILTIPFGYQVIPNVADYFSSFFAALSRIVGVGLFGIEESKLFEFYSDSTGMYVHVFNLFIVSIILALVFLVFKGLDKNKLKAIVEFFAVYFIVLHLFSYGFNKVFKQQFYAPEPNLLFTNLGYLTKDILYWSSMGTSYFYSVFMGVLEILVGLLLLYRKTRVFGVLAALAVLTNVVAINFGFDISVKVFSLFLLFLVLMLLLLYKENVKPLLGLKTNFLIGKSRYLLFNEKPIIKPILKTLVVLLFLVEATYGNMASNNYNDDNFVFSELQGAYDLEGSESYSQLFIHRGGYLILKTHNDKMIDYNLELLELSREMHLLKDRNGEELGLLNYQMKSNGLLLLDGNIEGVVVNGLLAKPIALSDLPINEKGFHWTVD